MRWYEITITDPAQPSAKPQVYTSWVNGRNDPGALNVNFDFNVVPYSLPRGASVVEIWGIPLQSISWAYNLVFKNIVIKAGFKPGLPLATAAAAHQSGPIVTGFILQSFGNWIGTNMTLNLVVSAGSAPLTIPTAASAGQQAAAASQAATPPMGSPSAPINLPFNMPVGTTMAAALKTTLLTGLPSFVPDINIREIVSTNPEIFTSRSVGELAQKIKQLSRKIVGSQSYPGVEIAPPLGNTISVYDDTKNTKVQPIDFRDLIGQPTWIEPFKIQFKCPMRADLQVGDTIQMPEGVYYSTLPNQAATPYDFRGQSAQRGKFFIQELRHVGNFRQPDANSWATVVTCVALPVGT